MQKFIPLAVGLVMMVAGLFNVRALTYTRGLRWLDGVFGEKGPRIGAAILGVVICIGFLFT